MPETSSSRRDYWIKDGIKLLIEECHGAAVKAGWYNDIETGERKVLNDGERMMLIVTEVSEAFEGLRRNLMDDHLPHRKSVEVELADVLIRIADYAGENNLDLGGAIIEKLAYNAQRADHKLANRQLENGKKF